MTANVPGADGLVSYIRTGGRDFRTAYRSLPREERFAYCDLVTAVFAVSVSHHFDGEITKDRVDRLIARVGARHPQYGGGVKRVLRSLLEGEDRLAEISPQQILTAQHLVIRELAKLHLGLQSDAERLVAEAQALMRDDPDEPKRAQPEPAPKRVDVGPIAAKPEIRRLRGQLEEHERRFGEMGSAIASARFSGSDAEGLATVVLGFTGSLRSLELHQGVERVGGRSIADAIESAWMVAERERAAGAAAFNGRFGVVTSAEPAPPEPVHRQAQSDTGLCKIGVDRYGRLGEITFLRADLLGSGGRRALATEIRETVVRAQSLAVEVAA